jgi:hypothetical protein
MAATLGRMIAGGPAAMEAMERMGTEPMDGETDANGGRTGATP